MINKKEKIVLYSMMIPGMLAIISIIAYPLFSTVYSSFFRWKGLGFDMEFNGIRNYIKIFNDTRFIHALQNNVFWLVLYLIIPVLLGFILALLLNTSIRGQNFFKSVYYLPAVISYAVIGVIWAVMLNSQDGMINTVLRFLHLDFLAINWLAARETAIPALVIASSWQYTGFCMILFLAGLQQVPAPLIDAAEVDGASFYQKVLHIILPCIKPVTTVVILITVINSFRLFDLVYLISWGGPNRMTEVIAFVMYQESFEKQAWGMGNTYAVVLLVLTAGASILYVRQMLKKEEIN
jgi:ABC-type sugar transport system permease subunit